jgi:hypothetical protein
MLVVGDVTRFQLLEVRLLSSQETAIATMDPPGSEGMEGAKGAGGALGGRRARTLPARTFRYPPTKKRRVRTRRFNDRRRRRNGIFSTKCPTTLVSSQDAWRGV